jgi:hypothetical protein
MITTQDREYREDSAKKYYNNVIAYGLEIKSNLNYAVLNNLYETNPSVKP